MKGNHGIKNPSARINRLFIQQPHWHQPILLSWLGSGRRMDEFDGIFFDVSSDNLTEMNSDWSSFSATPIQRQRSMSTPVRNDLKSAILHHHSVLVSLSIPCSAARAVLPGSFRRPINIYPDLTSIASTALADKNRSSNAKWLLDPTIIVKWRLEICVWHYTTISHSRNLSWRSVDFDWMHPIFDWIRFPPPRLHPGDSSNSIGPVKRQTFTKTRRKSFQYFISNQETNTKRKESPRSSTGNVILSLASDDRNLRDKCKSNILSRFIFFILLFLILLNWFSAHKKTPLKVNAPQIFSLLIAISLRGDSCPGKCQMSADCFPAANFSGVQLLWQQIKNSIWSV